MTPGDLLGTVFGPTTVTLSPERVADFVAATGDDASRWQEAAPPGFAAVLLFGVAGDFLWDERIAEHTTTLLHLDQSFRWSGPLDVGATIDVTGRITRARERAGSFFVTFEADAVAAGSLIVASESTFVMAATATGASGEDHGEPPATARAVNRGPRRLSQAAGAMPSVLRSASRSDLVRYAAVTKDFNPIHWDHDAARRGGAPGVIVHGLLMLAWSLQAAAAIGRDTDPVADIRVRFRNPLRPGEQAVVASSVESADGAEAAVRLTVLRDDDELVTGRATVRLDRG